MDATFFSSIDFQTTRERSRLLKRLSTFYFYFFSSLNYMPSISLRSFCVYRFIYDSSFSLLFFFFLYYFASYFLLPYVSPDFWASCGLSDALSGGARERYIYIYIPIFCTIILNVFFFFPLGGFHFHHKTSTGLLGICLDAEEKAVGRT